METIDQSQWKRREAFELFSAVEYPFYAVTVPLDVTNVKKVSKENKISFYYLLVWVCTKAVNSTAQFRLRIRGNDIVRLDELRPSFTDIKKGDDQFYIVTMPWEADAALFCQKAARKSQRQQRFIESDEGDDMIYFSCTPWFDFTALTNEHRMDRDDLIPRIAWGKYAEEKGQLLVHLSIEVNHRMIDGIHIGMLKEAIDREIVQLRV